MLCSLDSLQSVFSRGRWCEMLPLELPGRPIVSAGRDCWAWLGDESYWMIPDVVPRLVSVQVMSKRCDLKAFNGGVNRDISSLAEARRYRSGDHVILNRTNLRDSSTLLYHHRRVDFTSHYVDVWFAKGSVLGPKKIRIQEMNIGSCPSWKLICCRWGLKDLLGLESIYS